MRNYDEGEKKLLRIFWILVFAIILFGYFVNKKYQEDAAEKERTTYPPTANLQQSAATWYLNGMSGYLHGHYYSFRFYNRKLSMEEMTSNFGVRLYFDETGTPALLSFGQWGSSYTGKSAAMVERAEEQALNQARLLADSSLTAFINSFMEAAESGDVGENISEGIVFTDDGNATPESVANVADVYLKKIKMTGADTMKGRSTAYDEVLTHPNGHKVAVVVRRWSFGTVDAVNAIDTPPAPEKPKADKPAANKEGAGVRKGRTYDF